MAKEPPPLPKRDEKTEVAQGRGVRSPGSPNHASGAVPSMRDTNGNSIAGKKSNWLALMLIAAMILLGTSLLCRMRPNSVFGPPKQHTASDFSTREVEELVRLLRDDEDLCNGCLNPSGANGPSRRVPYEVWKRLLGMPSSRHRGQHGTILIYQTSDGQVSIEAGLDGVLDLGCVLKTEIPSLLVWDVDFPIALNPNAEIDKVALKQLALSAMRQFVDEHGDLIRLVEKRRADGAGQQKRSSEE